MTPDKFFLSLNFIFLVWRVEIFTPPSNIHPEGCHENISQVMSPLCSKPPCGSHSPGVKAKSSHQPCMLWLPSLSPWPALSHPGPLAEPAARLCMLSTLSSAPSRVCRMSLSGWSLLWSACLTYELCLLDFPSDSPFLLFFPYTCHLLIQCRTVLFVMSSPTRK